MADSSPGETMRRLQQAQAAMKKARQALAQIRGEGPSPETTERIFRLGWDILSAAHRTLAEIPRGAATDEVLTRQIAVQRYATALLVRLRRLARNEALPAEDDDVEIEP